MATQILPITSDANQTFTCTLTINSTNTSFTFNFIFNEIAQYWCMSMQDSDGNNLIASVPLVPGTYPAANILKQYAYLNIGSAYLINIDGTSEQYPGESTLGVYWKLVWYE